MRTEFIIMATIGILVAFIFILFLIPVPKRDTYGMCSTVEFNPDLTAEMRKKCRDLRSTKY